MNYRLATDEDKPKIEIFVKEHGIPVPDFGVTFIAEDDGGGIIALANGGLVPYIETVVSRNSTAAIIVFSKLEGALELNSIGPMISTVGTDEGKAAIRRAGYKDSQCDLFIKRR